MTRLLQFVGGVFVVAVLAIVVLLYPVYAESQRSAAFTRIQNAKPPLSVAEVETLLGTPNRVDHAESTGLTADAYYFRNGNREMKVTFLNGVVFPTDLTDPAKS